MKKPDYKKIYTDILYKKYPDRIEECLPFLYKESLSVMDILEINKKIFRTPSKETEIINQKHRSYHKADILKILDFQKRHLLNNVQLAAHFKMSRNTIARWKKYF